jgi:hypothetical protein
VVLVKVNVYFLKLYGFVKNSLKQGVFAHNYSAQIAVPAHPPAQNEGPNGTPGTRQVLAHVASPSQLLIPSLTDSNTWPQEHIGAHSSMSGAACSWQAHSNQQPSLDKASSAAAKARQSITSGGIENESRPPILVVGNKCFT